MFPLNDIQTNGMFLPVSVTYCFKKPIIQGWTYYTGIDLLYRDGTIIQDGPIIQGWTYYTGMDLLYRKGLIINYTGIDQGYLWGIVF